MSYALLSPIVRFLTSNRQAISSAKGAEKTGPDKPIIFFFAYTIVGMPTSEVNVGFPLLLERAIWACGDPGSSLQIGENPDRNCLASSLA
jgi:hypothetical protein